MWPLTLALLLFWLLAPAKAIAPARGTQPLGWLATACAQEDPTAEWIRLLGRHARDPFEQDQRERAIRELARLGGPRAAEALLPLTHDPFVHLADHVLGALVEALGGPEAAATRQWLLEDGLDSREPLARRAVWLALAQRPDPQLGARLRKSLERERDARVLGALLQAARAVAPDPALGDALAALLTHKDPQLVCDAAPIAALHAGMSLKKTLLDLLAHKQPLARAGALDGLAHLGAVTSELAGRCLRDSAHEPQIALADAVARRDAGLVWPAEGSPVLRALLEHGSWRARSAAIQAALRLWDPAVIPWLIERLRVERGRLRDDLRRALETLTGQGIGDDPELWGAWWEVQKERFDPGARPTPDGQGRVRFAPPREHSAKAGTRTVAFFDLPLGSERMAFLFDLSGSMRNPARKGEAGPTKLELLRHETARTLQTLAAGTHFDLFVYRYPSEFPPAPRLTRALGRLEEGSTATARKAMKWLEAQEARGWGAFYEPLVALFAEDVDTIVLLSDGRPSRGLYDRDERLLAELPRENRFSQVAVCTVLIGQVGADRRFMEDLAAATGGRFAQAADPQAQQR